MLNRVFTAMLLVAVLGAPAWAGKFNKVLEIGEAAPDFVDLAGVDGKTHSLADFKSSKLVVVVFASNQCAVSRSYERRIMNLAKEFAAKGVALVAINSNLAPEDALPAMKDRAKARGYEFPYLFDATQKVGRAYGAAVTPDVIVLDQNRKVAYLGAVDDSWDEESRVKQTYLHDAVEALLAGKKPVLAETRAKGCGIEYE